MLDSPQATTPDVLPSSGLQRDARDAPDAEGPRERTACGEDPGAARRVQTVNVKKNSTQLRTESPFEAPGDAPFGGYPERKGRAVPPPAELAKVPASNAYCYSQLCLEIKYNLPYYLRKSDLMRFLREQHDFWWAKYTLLYEKDAYTYPTSRMAAGWDYTNAAKEMLSRCKLFDSLFTQVLKLDLCHVNDFGAYCKMVFLELNKLKPAFPEAPCSQGVFELSVKDIMKFILKQAPVGFSTDPVDLAVVPTDDLDDEDDL